jgi:hypothetical protein
MMNGHKLMTGERTVLRDATAEYRDWRVARVIDEIYLIKT